MNWLWDAGQWVMSFVPWWVYAACAVAIYFTVRSYFGEKLALVYAIAAAVFTYGDFLADGREAWVREQWRASVERAKAAIAADDSDAAGFSKSTDDQLLKGIVNEAIERKKVYDELRSSEVDGVCTVAPADADRLKVRGP